MSESLEYRGSQVWVLLMKRHQTSNHFIVRQFEIMKSLQCPFKLLQMTRLLLSRPVHRITHMPRDFPQPRYVLMIERSHDLMVNLLMQIFIFESEHAMMMALLYWIFDRSCGIVASCRSEGERDVRRQTLKKVFANVAVI